MSEVCVTPLYFILSCHFYCENDKLPPLYHFQPTWYLQNTVVPLLILPLVTKEI